MKLKDNILNDIRKNHALRRALMDLDDKKESTILRWLRENSTELLVYSRLQIISAYLKEEIDDMVILEDHDFKPVV